MYNPFVLLEHLDWISWALLPLFFVLFAFVPLCCTRDNYDLLLFEKLRFRFALLILFLCAFVVVYALGETTSQYWITPAVCAVVKIYEYFAIYSRVKYLDDGHDFVSRLEFICLHMTFSFCSAWLSYILVFCIFNSMALNSHVD